MFRLALICLLALPLAAWSGGTVAGQVTDGVRPLPGVQVFEDMPPRVAPAALPPVAVTDAEGRFALPAGGPAPRLVFQKEGFQRVLRPVPDTGRPLEIALHPAPAFRREQVLLVRLAFPDEAPVLPEAQLRALLFSRTPGVASVANYLYEVSKGSLILEEGLTLALQDPHRAPRHDDLRDAMIQRVLLHLKGRPLGGLDRVDNATGALQPDGKPDHLWILAPGAPKSVTNEDHHLRALCTLSPLPWRPSVRWPVVFSTEQVPLGNLVHEAFHAMGEHRVDDFYVLADPGTAGAWDLMDAGLYRGWDRAPSEQGPWQADMGYSPSQPMGWTRAELWYRGAFRATVRTQWVQGNAWTGWLEPLAAAPGGAPQRLLVRDPRARRRFWEFNVRRPWGFDQGRVGQRWGPGYEGLVVARVDPSLLSSGEDPRGPVRVLDAHPGTAAPEPPRYPHGRWELDDAAFNLGPGEAAAGHDGPLRWEVLETDASGRMRVRIRLQR